MKKLLFRLALLGLCLIPLAGVRAAFDSSVVAADSKWVFHADLNALRASVIGKELVAEAEKMKLDAADMKVGVDVQKLAATIGSVTGYGANFSKDSAAVDGTLVIRGTADLRKIAEGALVQATVTTPEHVTEIKDLPFPAYAISGGQGKRGDNAMEVVVAFPPEPVVLVSKSKAQLIKAREVIRGSAPSLAKNPSSPLHKLAGGIGNAYLFAASVVPSEQFFPEDGPQARILQMAKSGSLALGENGPLTFAHVELVASSDVMADKLVKILQGMTAMLSLAETSDKQLAEFLNSATVAREGNSVALNLSYDSVRLVQMLHALQEERLVSRPRETPRANLGQVTAEWKANEVNAGTDSLAWKTIENVSLTNNATIVIAAKLNGAKNVRLDRVELVPGQSSGSPLVFRGEYMRLSGWSIDKSPSVSGGKLLTARAPTNTARLQFPGPAGVYTLKVGYVTDQADEAAFTIYVKEPESPKEAPKSKE